MPQTPASRHASPIQQPSCQSPPLHWKNARESPHLFWAGGERIEFPRATYCAAQLFCRPERVRRREPCAGLYVVEAGRVRIYKSSSNGREQVLSIDGPGSSIAELPVFDGGNYPASGTAIDDAILLFVSKQDFQALCLAHPQVALKVLCVIGSRLRRLVGIIEELSFTTAARQNFHRIHRLEHSCIPSSFHSLR
jgi:CRP-like cAMP-binding protein